MVKLPKINFKAILSLDEIKLFFSKERMSAFFRKENFTSDKILTALRSDGYSITYLALFIGTVIAIIVSSNKGVGTAQSVTLSLFTYFNVVLFVYLIRHRQRINWAVVGWTCVALFVIAIGIFIMICMAFKGWDKLLSIAMYMGVIAVPVMAFDKTFRQQVVGSCFSMFFKAVEECFNERSMEGFAGAAIGTMLLGILLVMIILGCGTLGAVVFYVSRTSELLLLSAKFAKEDFAARKNQPVPQQLTEGCIDADTGAVERRAAMIPTERATNFAEKQTQHEEDDVIIIE